MPSMSRNATTRERENLKRVSDTLMNCSSSVGKRFEGASPLRQAHPLLPVHGPADARPRWLKLADGSRERPWVAERGQCAQDGEVCDKVRIAQQTSEKRGDSRVALPHASERPDSGAA